MYLDIIVIVNLTKTFKLGYLIWLMIEWCRDVPRFGLLAYRNSPL